MNERGARLGTFGGVFTPSILTILGVILFMRAGLVIGAGGVLRAVAILVLAKTITTTTALSMSAVATNIPVRGGGAYYLISRVLGPEFGGAIGVSQYAALAISVPFYVLGFTEALVASVPALDPWTTPVAVLTCWAMLAVSWVGAGWAIRTQYVVMAILGLGLVSLLGGAAMAFDPATFAANLGPASEGERWPFWVLFAIYFPAVTGIDAGVNMSGDLQDPARSIPRGTLAAIAVGFAVYLVEIVLVGGAFDRSTLIDAPYTALRDSAAFGTGFLVVGGVLAATISSALGSCLGAPRVLQAVARDGSVPGLGAFAAGSGPNDEPRRALLLTAVVTTAVLLWALSAGGGEGGALNLVAGLITMFFLAGYGVTNAAAFTEAIGGNPSFRPRFRFFHWSASLVGAVGCAGAAFLINPAIASLAVVLISLLLLGLRRRELRRDYPDARRGFWFSAVRRNLLRLDQTAPDSRNWRPGVLVFSGNPETREALVSWGIWLEARRGLVVLVNLVVGDPERDLRRRTMALSQLRTFCAERRLQAFPMVFVAPDVDTGVSMALQTAGLGPLRPNLALFGWAGDRTRVEPLGRSLRLAENLGIASVLLGGHDKDASIVADRKHPTPRRIDVWWRGRRNGELMLLLAHLIGRNWEWSLTRVRLLRVVADEQGVEPARQALRALADAARLDVHVQVVQSQGSFNECLATHSGDADCTLLGFLPPEAGSETAWHDRYGELLAVLPTALLVSSPADEHVLV